METRSFARRGLALIFAAVALLCCMAFAPKAEAATSGDFEYELMSGTEMASITGYVGDDKDVVIPLTIDGYGVFQIEERAFFDNDEIESLAIDASTLTICGSAFKSCDNLKTVVAHTYVYVHEDAFASCSSLESVEFHSVSMSSGAISDCPSLKEIVFLGGFESHGAAISDNASLESIEFHGIVQMHSGGVYNCPQLSSMTFLDSIIDIGNKAFCGLDSLESLTLPGCGSFLNAFEDCPSLKSITFLGKASSIGTEAFSGCESLESVAFRGDVGQIFQDAFSGCESLESVAFHGDIEYPRDHFLSGLSSGCKVFVWTDTLYEKLAGNPSYIDTEKTTVEYAPEINLAYASVEVPDAVYAGVAAEPDPTVALDGKVLVEGVDYAVSCENNVNAGTATMLVEGIGSYRGSQKTDFAVAPAAVSKAAVASIAAKTYTGSYIKPTPAVKANGKTLVPNRDYTLSYKNNLKSGKATVTVKGKGNYVGSKSATFKIKPAKVLYPKATSLAKGKVKASWSNARGKAANVTGYKVVVKSGAKNVKTVFVAGKAANAKTVAVPAKYKGKRLNVRVYAYKTIDGVKVLGPSSAVKYVTVRK